MSITTLPMRYLNTNMKFNQLKIMPRIDYCIKSDTYKYFHPDVVMNDLHVVREESYEIPKKIVR